MRVRVIERSYSTARYFVDEVEIAGAESRLWFRTRDIGQAVAEFARAWSLINDAFL